MIRTILLENMNFHAYHGCLEEEKVFGNDFLVSVEMKLDTGKAEISDKLEDTLNYQRVYDAVKDEMEKPSQLIEHIGRRLLDRIVRSFPKTEQVVVRLSKLNPPLGGDVEKVTIVLENKK